MQVQPTYAYFTGPYELFNCYQHWPNIMSLIDNEVIQLSIQNYLVDLSNDNGRPFTRRRPPLLALNPIDDYDFIEDVLQEVDYYSWAEHQYNIQPGFHDDDQITEFFALSRNEPGWWRMPEPSWADVWLVIVASLEPTLTWKRYSDYDHLVMDITGRFMFSPNHWAWYVRESNESSNCGVIPDPKSGWTWAVDKLTLAATSKEQFEKNSRRKKAKCRFLAIQVFKNTFNELSQQFKEMIEEVDREDRQTIFGTIR